MFRGTTPSLKFEVSKNIDLSLMQEIWLTIKDYDQNITLKLTEGSRLEIDDDENTISVELTQAETLGFKAKEVKMQLRFLSNDNKAYASDIYYVTLADIIKDGAIS